jgi:hypothetical protein
VEDATASSSGAGLERPSSPWTPSYSVSTQGPGIAPEDSIPATNLGHSEIAEEPIPNEAQAETQVDPSGLPTIVTETDSADVMQEVCQDVKEPGQETSPKASTFIKLY